jgi:hypothetical protein
MRGLPGFLTSTPLVSWETLKVILKHLYKKLNHSVDQIQCLTVKITRINIIAGILNDNNNMIKIRMFCSKNVTLLVFQESRVVE